MLAKVVHAALLPAKGASTMDNSSAKWKRQPYTPLENDWNVAISGFELESERLQFKNFLKH